MTKDNTKTARRRIYHQTNFALLAGDFLLFLAGDLRLVERFAAFLPDERVVLRRLAPPCMLLP
jgi:hypothetical protein